MEVTRLGNWYIKNNELSISFMRYNVLINIRNEDCLFYELIVIHDNKEKLGFNFYNLEEAINFTQNVVAISKCEEEIVSGYLLFLKEKMKLIKK